MAAVELQQSPSGGRKFALVGAIAGTAALLMLIGAFLIFPALAERSAKNRIESALTQVSDATGVSFKGVTVDANATNAFSALAGNKISGVTVDIDEINLPEDEFGDVAIDSQSGGDAQEILAGFRDAYDDIGESGKFVLYVGSVSGEDKKVDLTFSSLIIDGDSYTLSLYLDKGQLDEFVVSEHGMNDLAVSVDDDTVTAEYEAEPDYYDYFDSGPESHYASLKVEPAEDGRSVTYTVDGSPNEIAVDDSDCATVKEITLSEDDDSLGARYRAEVQGNRSFGKCRRWFDKSFWNEASYETAFQSQIDAIVSLLGFSSI